MFVSTGVGATVVVSFTSAGLSDLLLQATIDAAITAIARNFFIFCDFLELFEIFRCLYLKKKKVTRLFNFFFGQGLLFLKSGIK